MLDLLETPEFFDGVEPMEVEGLREGRGDHEDAWRRGRHRGRGKVSGVARELHGVGALYLVPLEAFGDVEQESGAHELPRARGSLLPRGGSEGQGG